MSDNKDIKKLWDEAVNNLSDHFQKLKPQLDKFPLAYSLQYSLKDGYTLVINEDYLAESNPIEWSKSQHSTKPHVKIRDMPALESSTNEELLKNLGKGTEKLNIAFKELQDKYPFVTEFKITKQESDHYRIYNVIDVNQATSCNGQFLGRKE